jgi:hypothetical protein
MPLSMFGRSRWFGDDEEDQPTPLFPATADKQSLFPVKSDESPVLSGLKGAWKGATDWLAGPAASDAGTEGNLLGYKPTNRWGAISDALGGAAEGVLHARGPYSNWFGEGLLGAGKGMAHTREHDLELRKLAEAQQYKQAEMALKRVQAAHAGDYTIGRTRYDAANKPLVTAPPEEMSEADKARIANEDRRIDLEGRRADQTEAFQRAQLAQGAAGQAEAAGYHKTEAELARQRLEVERQNAGTPKTEPERRDKRMLDYSAAVAAGKTPTPEQVAQHERDYREAAQDKRDFNPATGTTTIVRPDLGDIPRPPSMAGTPVPPPGAETVPTTQPSAVIEDVGKKYTAFKSVQATARRVLDLAKDITPSEMISSDKASQIGVNLGSLVNALAEAGGTGKVDAGEAKRYTDQLSEMQGWVAAGKNILGIERFKSTIKEAANLVLRSTKASARMATPEQAKRLPPDTPFLLPNGRLAVARPDGSGVDYLDEGD